MTPASSGQTDEAARIGLLLGSRDSSGALVAGDGRILARVSVPNAGSPAEGIEGLAGMAIMLRRKAERLGMSVAAVGVGFPGVIDPEDGTVLGTRIELRAWIGSGLAAALGARLDLAVTVRNDVVSIMLAEAAIGSAKGERDVVLAYSSTGVGGSIMLGGQVLLGRRGAVGHLGHVPSAAADGLRCSCGGSGHLDSVASATGITRWYREQRHLDPGDAPYLRVVTDAAARGDALARQALQRGGAALGTALGGIVNLLEPDVVIIAGESSRNDEYREAALEALRAEVIPGNVVPEVRVNALGGDAQVIGAALSA